MSSKSSFVLNNVCSKQLLRCSTYRTLVQMSENKTIPIEIPIESSSNKLTVQDAGKDVKIKQERAVFKTSILDFLPPIKNTSNFSYHLSSCPPRTVRSRSAKSENFSIVDLKQQIPTNPVKFKVLTKSPRKSNNIVNKKEIKKQDDDIVEAVIPVPNNFKERVRIIPKKFPSMQNVDHKEKIGPFIQPRSVVEESSVNGDESNNRFSDGLKYFTNQWRSMQKEFLDCPKSTNISLREAMTLINEVKNRLTKKTNTVIHESEIRAERDALTSNYKFYPKPSPSSVLNIKAPIKFVPFDSTVKISTDQQKQKHQHQHQHHESYEINRSLAVPTFKYKLPAIKRVTARPPNVNTFDEMEKRSSIYNGDTYRKNKVLSRSMVEKKTIITKTY